MKERLRSPTLAACIKERLPVLKDRAPPYRPKLLYRPRGKGSAKCCSTAAKPHAHVFDVQKFLDAVSARAQPGQAKLKKCCRAGGKLQLSLEHTQIKSMPEQGQQQAACVLTLIARAPDRFASRLQMARPRWLWLPHLFRPYLCDMKRQIDNGLTGMEGLRTQNCTHAEAAK
eukprot:1161605-Pelagomonas_calceolata.AAC.10